MEDLVFGFHVNDDPLLHRVIPTIEDSIDRVCLDLQLVGSFDEGGREYEVGGETFARADQVPDIPIDPDLVSARRMGSHPWRPGPAGSSLAHIAHVVDLDIDA